MVSARRSGIFEIGGETPVHRLGFGAMRITGNGVWGEPENRAEALRVLRRLSEIGVDFVDTADSYGPNVSEELIREALAPYDRIIVATKAGLTRTGPNRWIPLGRPEYLIQQAHASRLRLGVETIDLWQLHRIDPSVPRDEQFAAIKSLIDDKVIRHAGLSEVSVEEIEAAARVFPVATVQNKYNLGDRASEAVLDHCATRGVGFIPWYPLAAGALARPGGALDRIAAAHRATPGQIALAWLLKRSPVMLPIPGTSQVAHLMENVEAAEIELSGGEFEALSAGSA
jgi:pyridoxine 4-dehydrogenase